MFGQFWCRRIAISFTLDFSSLFPRERARICLDDYSVSVLFQGNIIKTLIFENTPCWHRLYYHSDEIIKLSYAYTKENVRNLILALADYATLYDLPITFAPPQWMLFYYNEFIKMFRTPSSPSSPVPFKDLFDYLTRYTDFSYESSKVYKYRGISIPFPTQNNEKEQLYWIYVVSSGGLFQTLRPTPPDFIEQITMGYRAAKSKHAGLSSLTVRASPPLIADWDFVTLSRLPWVSCFEPTVFPDTELERFDVFGNASNMMHLHLYFNITPGASQDIHAIFPHENNLPTPLFLTEALLNPTRMPVCELHPFRGRYTVRYRSQRVIKYPISFQIEGKDFMIDSRTLLLDYSPIASADVSYLNALCPIEGSLFWKKPGMCSFYNNAGTLGRVPVWYTLIPPHQSPPH